MNTNLLPRSSSMPTSTTLMKIKSKMHTPMRKTKATQKSSKIMQMCHRLAHEKTKKKKTNIKSKKQQQKEGRGVG